MISWRYLRASKKLLQFITSINNSVDLVVQCKHSSLFYVDWTLILVSNSDIVFQISPIGPRFSLWNTLYHYIHAQSLSLNVFQFINHPSIHPSSPFFLPYITHPRIHPSIHQIIHSFAHILSVQPSVLECVFKCIFYLYLFVQLIYYRTYLEIWLL